MAENLLTVENLSKSFGEKQLFDGISFGVNKGQKVALVARNGAGKTTLLNIIAKRTLPDSGEVSFRNDIHYIYLEQNPYLDTELSVLDVIFTSDNPTMVAVREYEEAMYIATKDDNEVNQQRLIDAMSEIDRLSAWDYDSKAKEILSKLGITNLEQKVATLSGGEKKKVALSKVLIEGCDLLILDEPTNHLDVAMIEWLEDFLKRSSLTLLVVTHDRYFINNVCTDVYEIDRGEVFKYKGDYNYFLENKELRETIFRQEVEKAKNLYKKELDWMRRMPQARTTKSKARIDAFYDLKEKTELRFEQKAADLSIRSQRMGKKILEISNISKKFDDKVILDDFTYVFKSGEKIGIIGGNGVGKSTFLNIITENERADSGKVSTGQTIKYGYYRQNGLEEKEDMRVIDIIKEVAESIKLNDKTELSASLFLTYFGFGTDLQYNFYSNLSGGERRRLYLLKVLISNPNFLILDEPTNDLDIYNLGVLENFLKEYQGCLLIVSHDRSFMDNLVDHIFVFEGEGKVRDYHSNYSDYLETKLEEDKIKTQAERENNQRDKAKQKIAEALVVKDEPKRKLSYSEQKEFEKIEKDLPLLEKEKEDISSKLSSGELEPEDLVSLSLRYEEIDKALEEKELRWIELSEFL
ncbi:MAG: ABC-F family ATP-binding cassette domain-containing protein [Bacteroidales bacterium]|nr:ABC-F family ATP-binding cassette domain-containing protein [Bacteroidales bacterium]MDD4685322.1 ABC-F family ATP-binding cassette domain-containing protein [Bacteroidales bacterium]